MGLADLAIRENRERNNQLRWPASVSLSYQTYPQSLDRKETFANGSQKESILYYRFLDWPITILTYVTRYGGRF
jgi:hypothetical protein